jgi:hypothetical protein
LGQRPRAAGVLHGGNDSRIVNLHPSRERGFNPGRVRGGRRRRWRRSGSSGSGRGRRRKWRSRVLCKEIHLSTGRLVRDDRGNWWIGRRGRRQRWRGWGKHYLRLDHNLQRRVGRFRFRLLDIVRLDRRRRDRWGRIDRRGYQHWRSSGRTWSYTFRYGLSIRGWRKFLLRRWCGGCRQRCGGRSGRLWRRGQWRVYADHHGPGRREWKPWCHLDLGIPIALFFITYACHSNECPHGRRLVVIGKDLADSVGE